MAKKDYTSAIKSYGEAIKLDGRNAVYWSNRCVHLFILGGFLEILLLG